VSKRSDRNNRHPERNRRRELPPMPRPGPVRANGFTKMQRRLGLTLKKSHARAQGKPIAGDKPSTPPPPKPQRYVAWKRGLEGQGKEVHK